MRAKVYNQRQTNHHKLQATIMKKCKMTFQVSCIVEYPDEMPLFDARCIAQDLLIRPNFASVVEGVKLVEPNKVITTVSFQLA